MYTTCHGTRSVRVTCIVTIRSSSNTVFIKHFYIPTSVYIDNCVVNLSQTVQIFVQEVNFFLDEFVIFFLVDNNACYLLRVTSSQILHQYNNVATWERFAEIQ